MRETSFIIIPSTQFVSGHDPVRLITFVSLVRVSVKSLPINDCNDLLKLSELTGRLSNCTITSPDNNHIVDHNEPDNISFMTNGVAISEVMYHFSRRKLVVGAR